MNVRGLLVHLYRGGWAVYRPTTAAPLPDLLLDGSPPTDDEPGGILIMVKEGEMWPVKVEKTPEVETREPRRVRGKRKAIKRAKVELKP